MSVRDALFLELAVRIFLKIDMKLEDDKWKKATGPDFLEQAYAYDKSAWSISSLPKKKDITKRYYQSLLPILKTNWQMEISSYIAVLHAAKNSRSGVIIAENAER